MKIAFSLPLFALALTANAGAQVVYATDDQSDMENFRLDVATGVSSGPVWTGAESWGLADDDTNQVMYVSEGQFLYGWSYGDSNPAAVVAVVTNSANGNGVPQHGLAFHAGTLYAMQETGGAGVEGLYSVDLVTGSATAFYLNQDTGLSVGGIDVDPATGLFYGSNDGAPFLAGGRGIVEYDTTAMTETYVSAYPTGISDVDGLAFDPTGFIYLIEDQAAPLHTYDLGAGAYVPNPPQNSVVGEKVYSSGTWSDVVGAGPVGTNYCTAAANSTGAAAVIELTGSASAVANDLTLTCSDMPQNAFAYFLTSTAQAFVQMPGGSQGNLCLGGSIGRYVGPGQIQNSGGAGAVSLTVDLTMHPTPTGFVTVQAGETWNFQCWFRDAVMGSATSNFSDGAELTFL